VHVVPFIESCIMCKQALKEGTLDNQVFSLQARQALFKSLDLIPPQYTYEAACAAVQATAELVPAQLASGSNGGVPDSSAQQQGHGPCLPLQVLLLLDGHCWCLHLCSTLFVVGRCSGCAPQLLTVAYHAPERSLTTYVLAATFFMRQG
jgi:hypothetical protein